jgi:uracil phosphoribosyltransferase
MSPGSADPRNVAHDSQHRTVPYRAPEIEHRYGAGVHILADPLALTMLARLCRQGTVQPEVNRLVGELYAALLHAVIASEFPRRVISVETRMVEFTPAGVWTGEAIAQDTRAVCVALARAGLLPSQVAYDFLNQVLDPAGVRQDHLSLGRTVDASGAVTGAGLHASKIGGSVDGAIMLIPDPMGATGSTVTKVLGHYADERRGAPTKVIAVHLIITPEYLRHVRASHPEVIVYALRLDRGLSPADVLESVPGARWDEERGLTDHHYIVPGGGGLGEVMNNSFV